MKKLHNLKIAATCLIIAVVVTMACNKTNETPVAGSGDGDLTELFEKSKAMQKHVEAFKAKMEYYRDNPGIKSGGSIYSADSGAIELESLLNYNFCYTGIECNKKTFVTSEVTMPLDDLQKINDPKLMEVYYDKVIDTIQAQMGRVNYTNMKLLMVDLKVESYDSNDDAVISVGALIGNEGIISRDTDEIGWWYGHEVGNCEGPENAYQGKWDAAYELQYLLDHSTQFNPAPPLGYVRRYKILHTECIINPNQPQYRTENDVLDNFLDYDIFYASSSTAPINDDTRCLSNDIEIVHYEQSYSNVTQDVIDDQSIILNYDFSYVNILIEAETGNNESYLKHILTINMGEEWLITESGFVVNDILAY